MRSQLIQGRGRFRASALRPRDVIGAIGRNRLVLATGLAAAMPVIVSTIHAIGEGWLPLGDDAIIAVRSFDVLSTHPPLLGPYSTSSQVIGHPVLSPGPMLFWLLALPVRLGQLAPAITMGIVNTAAVVGVVALARRRGGNALMLATAAAVALMCGSLDASILSDVWGPSASVLPFTLLIFLAWSLACGEYRLLPLSVLVASFAIQAHLTYALPAAALLAVALGFLAASRPRIPRHWLVATLAVVLVCWSFPIAEEAVHRPGNVERIVQTATAGGPKLGGAAGWHAVTRAIGIPPWWLRPPRAPIDRIVEVSYGPRAPTEVTAVLVLAALVAVTLTGLLTRRRDLAAAALLALGMFAALGVSTASTPTSHGLFAVVSYTLWWASPAGMFGWLVLGFAAATWVGSGGRRKALRARFAPPGPARSSTAVATAAGVLAVAAVGGLVAGAGEPDRLERLFAPARKIVDGVTAATPVGGAVLVRGSPGEIATDLQGGVAYGLRREGVPFVISTLPGIGTRYDPGRNGHDRVMEVIERPPQVGVRGRVIARAVLSDVPANGSPLQRATRAVVVTLAP